MRVKLLIAAGDLDYADHLSNMISERHADVINVSVCKSKERLQEMLMSAKADVALLDPAWADGVDLSMVRLPLLLWTEDENDAGRSGEIKPLRKYQRVSYIVTEILENHAKVTSDDHGPDSGRAHITAVWSPAGGVGKTTVAMAYAAKKASEGRQALYLNLELFSSVPVYFSEQGKSISTVFEMLENNEGNVRTLIRGVRRQDSATGVIYFCPPDNFDDMNILSPDNISALISSCAGVADELVIDMSCACDESSRRTLEFADRIFLVTDAASTSQIKISQFTSQHNTYSTITEKTVLVANMGAAPHESFTGSAIRLPHIRSVDALAVYKTLSRNGFETQVYGS